MVDFDLSEDDRAIVQTAREFVQKEVMPVAHHYDQSMEYPWPVTRKAHEAGLLNLCVPEKYGGLGLSHFTACLVVEELARGCSGISTAMTANDLALGPLFDAGTPELFEELAVPMLKPAEKPLMAAYCVTEPGAGSDVQSIRTSVRKDGDYYIMNGEKMWITNASVASWYYVLATLDSTQGHRAMCAFAVPANLPGITPGKKEVNMGQRCSDTRAIVFKDVKIHKKYLLGSEGQGFKIAMRAFDLSRPAVAAGAVGVAQSAFEHATKYALERKAFGKPIAEHQAVAFMLADMAKDIEASRLLTWRAARELDSGRRSTKFASMAKCFAGDTAVACTSNAVQIFGGYGFNSEYPVEKLYRDAKIYQIYEGTQQIQRLIISRHVLDEAKA
jgi:acyl-CoA dehydrogenase